METRVFESKFNVLSVPKLLTKAQMIRYKGGNGYGNGGYGGYAAGSYSCECVEEWPNTCLLTCECDSEECCASKCIAYKKSSLDCYAWNKENC